MYGKSKLRKKVFHIIQNYSECKNSFPLWTDKKRPNEPLLYEQKVKDTLVPITHTQRWMTEEISDREETY